MNYDDDGMGFDLGLRWVANHPAYMLEYARKMVEEIESKEKGKEKEKSKKKE
tara:strand:+ start:389 stop:544 length:156 start_codon:yes stop_codon:yes gene_type:complete